MLILVQLTFVDSIPPSELVWATMVLIPKRKGGYRGIGVVVVAWKMCAEVVNFSLKRSVELHAALHGFREGQRMGAATLEANLDQ